MGTHCHPPTTLNEVSNIHTLAEKEQLRNFRSMITMNDITKTQVLPERSKSGEFKERITLSAQRQYLGTETWKLQCTASLKSPRCVRVAQQQSHPNQYSEWQTTGMCIYSTEPAKFQWQESGRLEANYHQRIRRNQGQKSIWDLISA